MNANNNTVAIARDEQGNTIRVSRNNSEYGCVRLVQTKVAFNTQGWVRNSNLSTLIHGKVDDLKALNLDNKEELPGSIVIREQFEPFSTDNPDRDLKMAGNTGIVCCSNGQPIYRKTFYSLNTEQPDTLIAHTNGEDIKGANNMESVKSETKSTKKAKKEQVAEIVEEVIEEQEVVMEDESFEL